MTLPFHWEGYRVEDDSSAAFYMEGRGIFARSQEWVPADPNLLKEVVWDHLDRYNNNPTPFISVSTNLYWVMREARRRRNAGKRNVVVYHISLNGWGRQYNVRCPYFKHVKGLLRMARSPVPSYADYSCTEYEWLFFRHIPEEFIMGALEV